MINKQNNKHMNKKKDKLKPITKIIMKKLTSIKEGGYKSKSIRASEFFKKLKD